MQAQTQPGQSKLARTAQKSQRGLIVLKQVRHIPVAAENTQDAARSRKARTDARGRRDKADPEAILRQSQINRALAAQMKLASPMLLVEGVPGKVQSIRVVKQEQRRPRRD